MNTARKNCIWHDQCGSECRGCEHYSPVDDAVGNEEFYLGILEENAQEYAKIVRDFSDEGMGCS